MRWELGPGCRAFRYGGVECIVFGPETEMLWVTCNDASVFVGNTGLGRNTDGAWTFRIVMIHLNVYGAVTRRSRVP